MIRIMLLKTNVFLLIIVSKTISTHMWSLSKSS